MDSVRIALVEVSPLISKLLRAVVDGEEDLDVVTTARDGREMLELMEVSAPDVIVWGVSGPALAERALPVMRRCASLPVVGIASAGRAAAVCTLRPDLQRLRPLSGETLVALLRRLGRGEQ